LAAHAALTEAAIPVLAGAIGGFTRAASGGRAISARARVGEPAPVAEAVFGLAALGDLAGIVTTGSHRFRERSELELRVAPATRPRPASGIADLLARIPVAPNDHPAIHVERIDSALGRSWTVSIPGTASWSSVAGRTPFDATGNVRLISGGRSAGASAVLAAMRAAGVRKGEPVLLVGHSQGGLIAATLAADPAARREFSISHILTSGAPVASIPIPDRVQVLSVEHSDDLVPRLDGAANPDRQNWLTVSAPAPSASLPARTEPLVAHRLELYRRTAERIDASTDPSILHWRAGLSSFLGQAAGPASGAGWDVEVSRSGVQPGGEVVSSAR
jgi:pimeloyl-ACP methyl ester carboxylesterase